MSSPSKMSKDRSSPTCPRIMANSPSLKRWSTATHPRRSVRCSTWARTCWRRSILVSISRRLAPRFSLPRSSGSRAAWRALLDNLVNRGLKTPELVIVDGAPGLEKALAALWSDVLVQRCTVHKHRNLLAHAPERLHEEISADYKDMIYAGTKQEIERM